MRVRIDGTNVFDLDDPEIFENPILYVSEPGFWTIRESEAKNLRLHLLKGGFIIFDDFEGDGHWRQHGGADGARGARAALGPDITVDHPIFHSFFDIQKLDVPHPSVNVVRRLPRDVREQRPVRPDDRARELEQRPGANTGNGRLKGSTIPIPPTTPTASA